MRITEKGQITIPQEIREKYGFLPESEVQFVEENGAIYLQKIPRKNSRGKRLIDQMRNKSTVKMSTKEIMSLTRGEADE
jgi:antitoxin PrlF